MTTPNATQPLLETESLTKLYGVVNGVNDVTVTVPRGVWGLLGPNGSGKSTLLKLITGQLRPTEGTVRVLGRQPWNNLDLYRQIGFCPEQDAFYSFLSAFEFVRMLARLSGLSAPEARRRAEIALERAGATDFMHRPIVTYSKGMRQRTKVAQALVHDPEFVIFDEPLTGTDPVGRHELIELVRTLGNEGKSVLVSSHVLHEVEAMTDAFLLIHAGRLLASGTVESIRAVLSDAPHHVVMRAEGARELAARIFSELAVDSIDIDDDQRGLTVRTRDPHGFFANIARIVEESGARVVEMKTSDDDLAAVFKYLVARI